LGQKVAVTADVKDFFPRITHDQVFRVWQHTLGCSPQISRLLTQLTTYCGRLPQGAPTSTSLANLVMHNVGSEVRNVSDLLGTTHTTFVDDLTFSGERAREALNPTVQILRASGFPLPHRKIKIKSAGDQKAVTGVILGRSITFQLKHPELWHGSLPTALPWVCLLTFRRLMQR
jgi:RNA-directed DNA polymerase